MAARSYEERLSELQKKQEQLKAQERALKKRQSEDERKRRTRRLIELGGIVESVLGRPTTDDDKLRLMNFLKKQERNGSFFTKAMNEVVPPKEQAVEA
ncbi:Conjugal transfer protein TraD [Lachnospiraceae bacterium KHCPX20]|nr:Conjugal transfer protein TraD [Lachnospiraceae bacterium KHCPX20]